MTENAVIEYDGVEFSYKEGTPVLQGIDLSIEKGEFATIIGQNGAGKSTFAKHLNGLLTPDTGSVVIESDQKRINTNNTAMKKISSIVGYVFQNPDDQIFQTRVDREIEYGLKNIGIPESEREKRVLSVLEDVGLEGREDDNPFSMSVGERQRLAIAGVLAMEPDIICVDEPTTGQDERQARAIMDILSEFKERGHTVIVITHDMSLAAEYTERLLVMKDGNFIADGPPEEVFLQSEHLEKTNVRPPQITQLGVNLSEIAPEGVLEEMWLKVDDGYEDLIQYIESANNPAK